MEISIRKGTIEELPDCEEALVDSELGRTYFSDPGRAKEMLSEALTAGEIFVAINDHCGCVGYIWYVLQGAFCKFPYVRNIAVKREYRSRGVGKRLLSSFEAVGFRHSATLFLLVSDFNLEAKRLYEEIGYTQVGTVPDLFKVGVSEHVMIKQKL